MAQTSPLPREEVEALRARLLEEKERLEGELAGLRRTLEEMTIDLRDERALSTHIADLGTDTASQDVVQAQLQTLGDTLQQVEAALGRIEGGTYGLCVDCGQPIPTPRLQLMPYAARDVNCQTRFEKERRRTAGPAPRAATRTPLGRPQAGIDAGDAERRTG